MSTAPEAPEDPVLAAASVQAQAWADQMKTPAFDNAAFEVFNAWLGADPRHDEAFGVVCGRPADAIRGIWTGQLLPMLAADEITFDGQRMPWPDIVAAFPMPAPALGAGDGADDDKPRPGADRAIRDQRGDCEMDEGEDAAAARMLHEATAWMATLGSPDYTERTQLAFMAWIKADPRHECAFRQASKAGMPGGPRNEGPAPDAETEGRPSLGPVAYDARGVAVEDGILGQAGGGMDDDARLGPTVCEICGHPLATGDDSLCGDPASSRLVFVSDP